MKKLFFQGTEHYIILSMYIGFMSILTLYTQTLFTLVVLGVIFLLAFLIAIRTQAFFLDSLYTETNVKKFGKNLKLYETAMAFLPFVYVSEYFRNPETIQRAKIIYHKHCYKEKLGNSIRAIYQGKDILLSLEEYSKAVEHSEYLAMKNSKLSKCLRLILKEYSSQIDKVLLSNSYEILLITIVLGADSLLCRDISLAKQLLKPIREKYFKKITDLEKIGVCYEKKRQHAEDVLSIISREDVLSMLNRLHPTYYVRTNWIKSLREHIKNL